MSHYKMTAQNTIHVKINKSTATEDRRKIPEYKNQIAEGNYILQCSIYVSQSMSQGFKSA